MKDGPFETRFQTRRGFALPVVLLLLAVMSVMALRLAETSRSEIAVTRAHLAEAKARYAADAGYAALIAAASNGQGPPAHMELDLAGARITVSVSAESGKIDLNTGNPAMVAGIFRVTGMEPDRADALAEALAQRRSGVENDLLRTVDGLLDLPGVTLVDLARLRPFVTVHNGAQGIDVREAPREVLAAIPDMTPDLLDAIIAARDNEDALPRDARVLMRSFRSRGRPIYAVRVAAVLPDGQSFVREAIVELGDPRDPAVLSWRRAFEDTLPGGATLPATTAGDGRG